jgi:hypothetical protein
MATLHLMVGLPCSGKTTLAKQIEQERNALRLTPDEWISRLFGAISGDSLDAVRDPAEAVLWDLAARVLVLGVDVILDFGFWTRGEREEFHARAARLGAQRSPFPRPAGRRAAIPSGRPKRRSASRHVSHRGRADAAVVPPVRAAGRGGVATRGAGRSASETTCLVPLSLTRLKEPGRRPHCATYVRAYSEPDDSMWMKNPFRSLWE